MEEFLGGGKGELGREAGVGGARTAQHRDGRQRQNSSKAWPRRDGQNLLRFWAAFRVDAPPPPRRVVGIEGSVGRTTPSCDVPEGHDNTTSVMRERLRNVRTTSFPQVRAVWRRNSSRG
jgi:hypothetical protein